MRPGGGSTQGRLDSGLDGCFQRGTGGTAGGVDPSNRTPPISCRSPPVGKPVPRADTSFLRDSRGEEVSFEPWGLRAAAAKETPGRPLIGMAGSASTRRELHDDRQAGDGTRRLHRLLRPSKPRQHPHRVREDRRRDQRDLARSRLRGARDHADQHGGGKQTGPGTGRVGPGRLPRRARAAREGRRRDARRHGRPALRRRPERAGPGAGRHRRLRRPGPLGGDPGTALPTELPDPDRTTE